MESDFEGKDRNSFEIEQSPKYVLTHDDNFRKSRN